jgi:hypothetical protein
MKLAVNMGNYTCRYDDAASIDIVKAAGFEAMDWSLMDLVDDDAPFNRDDYLDQAKALRALCDQKQIPITQTHAPFSFAGWMGIGMRGGIFYVSSFFFVITIFCIRSRIPACFGEKKNKKYKFSF